MPRSFRARHILRRRKNDNACLEQQAQTELQLPHGVLVWRSTRIADYAEGLRTENRSGVAQIGVVQQVSGLCAGLQPEPLINMEVAEQRHVPFEKAWAV